MEERTRFAEETLAQFTERLASPAPAPGGGSASAVAGAMAASLLAMVARLSTDRPKYTDYASTHARALELADVARARLLDLADDDARAYAAFGAARKMPRESEEQQRARDDASRTAARLAAEVPLDVLRECARVAREVEAMAGRSNLNASSDLEVAARLAAAAGRGAAANVLVNLPMVEDDSYGGGLTAEVTELLEELERAAALVQETVGSGKLREPEPS